MLTALYLALAVAQGAPASAPPAPPPAEAGEQDIVVTGNRDTREGIRQFVDALTAVPSTRQIARFEHDVCPAVSGLPAVQRELVARRLRTIAAAAGIRVGGPRCVANVVLVITPDKRGFLELLRARRSDYFGDVPEPRIREMLRDPGPVAAWQINGPPMTARGTELFPDSDGTLTNRTTEPASRITAPVRPQFDAAIVVIQSSALEGLTTTELADYAAMRAFANIDPARLGKITAPTILTILDAPMGTAIPPTMTPWDLAFLRSFYAAPRNATTAAQRSAIARGMERKVAPSAPANPPR